jgi:hypothetical protein
MVKRFLFAALLAFVFVRATAGAGAEPTGEQTKYDVVVYGATPAGIAAAVCAADEGANVLLVEPSKYLGGMVSGGLGWSDYANKASIGGWARKFFAEIKKHYEDPSAWFAGSMKEYRKNVGGVDADVMWYFEPHVAEQTFEMLVKVPRLTIVREEPIVGVDKERGAVTTLRTTRGTYAGKEFIDASYEGDLLGAAEISCAIGRESRSDYNESLAGMLDPRVATGRAFHWFDADVQARDDVGNPLMGITVTDPGKVVIGAGDDKVQAYCFRVCLTDYEPNRIPITEPENYDPKRYEILRRYLAAKPPTALSQALIKISPLPNRKTDINNGDRPGPCSLDLPADCWGWTKGTAADRLRIWKDYQAYDKGLLYFLGHDPAVPEKIRQKMLVWGYPKDEYTDERDHWSNQIYVREARRLLGNYVVSQSDVQTNREKADSVGIGSYAMDSHVVERMITDKGLVANEGNFFTAVTKPYEIPYWSLTPRRTQCTNVLAPVCLSATHVAFGSIRMEPNWMVLGESSGVAAAMAAKAGVAVQDLEVPVLQKRLLARGQKLFVRDLPKTATTKTATTEPSAK